VIDEIGADGVVHAGHERHFQFGPDAIRARHQHRLGYRRIDREQSAERSDAGKNSRRIGLTRQRLDAPHGLIAGIDVDTGLAVIDAHSP
jgi:hypothetical protein